MGLVIALCRGRLRFIHLIDVKVEALITLACLGMHINEVGPLLGGGLREDDTNQTFEIAS